MAEPFNFDAVLAQGKRLERIAALDFSGLNASESLRAAERARRVNDYAGRINGILTKQVTPRLTRIHYLLARLQERL
jgi:hypothetical protein